MNGKTDEEIFAVRGKVIESTEWNLGEPVEVIDSFISEDETKGVVTGLWYLAKVSNCWLRQMWRTLQKDGNPREDARLRTLVLSNMG